MIGKRIVYVGTFTIMTWLHFLILFLYRHFYGPCTPGLRIGNKRNETGEKNEVLGCQVADNEQYSVNSRVTKLHDQRVFISMESLCLVTNVNGALEVTQWLLYIVHYYQPTQHVKTKIFWDAWVHTLCSNKQPTILSSNSWQKQINLSILVGCWIGS